MTESLYSISKEDNMEISPDKLRLLYVNMLRLRIFEERVAELLADDNQIKCPVHLYSGQEAVAVGVCASLRQDDYVFSTHRSHGHYLAKGGSDLALMEILGHASIQTTQKYVHLEAKQLQ